MYKHFRGGLTWLMVILIVASVLLSTIFIVTHSCHECTGPECQVCLQLHHAGDMLKKLVGGTSAIAALFLPAYLFLLYKAQKTDDYIPKRDTLFSQGVRINI